MSLIRSGAALCSRASSSSYYGSSIVCRSFHSLTTAAQRHGLTCRCCTLSASFSTISPAEEQFRKTLEGEKKEAQADYDKRMNIARTIAGPNVDINVHGDGELKSTDRVKRLINELSQLSIVEFKFVMDGVADKLGLPQPSKMMAFGGGFGGGAPAPAAPAAAAAAAGGAAPAAAAAAAPAKAAPAADKKSFNVRLDKFADKDKIKVIKEVRTATGLGLKESKDLVESLSSGPKTLKKDLKKEEAEALIAKLKEAGAEASLE